MDGDGDFDILVSALQAGMLFWYVNRLIDNRPPKVFCPSYPVIIPTTSVSSHGILVPPASCTAVASICTSHYLTLPQLLVVSDGSTNISLPVGSHWLLYTGIDLHKIQATCNFSVVVVDRTDPVILVCPPNIIRVTNLSSVVIDDLGAGLATDNVGVVLTKFFRSPENISVNNMSTFDIGTSLVTFVVFDAANNSASCSFQVYVLPLLANSSINIVEDVVIQYNLINISSLSSGNFQFSLSPWSCLPQGLSLNEKTGQIVGLVSGGALVGRLSNITIIVSDLSSKGINGIFPSTIVCTIDVYVWPPLVFYEELVATQDAPMQKFSSSVSVSSDSHEHLYMLSVVFHFSSCTISDYIYFGRNRWD